MQKMMKKLRVNQYVKHGESLSLSFESYYGKRRKVRNNIIVYRFITINTGKRI